MGIVSTLLSARREQNTQAALPRYRAFVARMAEGKRAKLKPEETDELMALAEGLGLTGEDIDADVSAARRARELEAASGDAPEGRIAKLDAEIDAVQREYERVRSEVLPGLRRRVVELQRQRDAVMYNLIGLRELAQDNPRVFPAKAD